LTKSFIEQQFPVSKLSKESYKERKANNGQTLTGLGKWWGRKPLVLVRATILGCLMPASDNPQKDMEIFLKIMSMDESGLWQRHKQWEEKSDNYWHEREKELYVDFERLGYDEKLRACVRPEQFTRPVADHAWKEINHHLSTNAFTLQDLICQLSEKRFGKKATVGDCFCGGGSIPFEAARLGLDVFASDLNPIAGLLTWAAIHICGASEDNISKINTFRQDIYDSVNSEITALDIEHNELSERAVSYLYCVETRCPECGVMVPMAPSWVIGKGTKTVAILTKSGDHYDIAVKMNATPEEIETAEKGTATSQGLLCPNCQKTTPINILRHDTKDSSGNTIYGLRKWEKTEFEPRPTDVFQERLYCIKYEKPPLPKKRPERYYRAPNEHDLANEEKVRQIVKENLVKWQEQELIPSMEIENGYNTDQLIRERGWTHWNHLFNPRQLLTLSVLMRFIVNETDEYIKIVGILGFNRCMIFNSRLSMWINGAGVEKPFMIFTNQALNTLYNYGCLSINGLDSCWFFFINTYILNKVSNITIECARNIKQNAVFWITDPPYADAINYHELSEVFLAWDKNLLKKVFPEWYTDSKRVLAVRGGDSFSQSMIDIYTNLTNHMPDDGMQVVMFTHSDPAVWAQLALIMWKSGLKVTAAWNIATETGVTGIKEGNYVKGTVLLVLRKRRGDTQAYLDEINTDIKGEVYNQIASMQSLEDKEDPNFADPDYVLAAYAASLKVLTSYSRIEDMDLDRELDRAIHDPKNSKVVGLIERANILAYDCIIPHGFDGVLWRELCPAERFYIKGLEYEKNGGYQISTYQEYARGFAIGNYSQLMANERANSSRLKTPTELAMRSVNDVPGFERSTLRLVLAAIHIAIKDDEKPLKGLGHIKNNIADYWANRELLLKLLAFLKDTRDIGNMPHWVASAQMAEHIFVLVEHDHV